MGWEQLISIACTMMGQADEIIEFVRTLGVSREDVEKVIAKNRARRNAELAEARAKEWPE